MHRVPSRLAFALALSCLPLPGQEAAPPHHIVEVAVADGAALERLVALDLDLAACTVVDHARAVEVVATDADLATLTGAGFSYRVAIRNAEAHYARELARHGAFPQTLTPPIGQGAMGGHYTLAQMEAILDKFATDYPNLCTPKVSIGKSIEGRDLWMVKISDNPGVDENEPEVLFDALHHAREPVSMEATLLFMDQLLSGYGTDPEATYLVDQRELFFVPCVNPDGYEYNRRSNPSGGGLWRKNRRGGYGVDLNRNYATGFGGSGSSGRQSSETYRGASPFSEPETAALEALAQAHPFAAVFSTHTYTDVLLRPWGYKTGNPANVADYDRIGDIATEQNRISHGPASTLLYIASGAALDHHHAAHGSLGWSAELGRSSEGGFWPNPSNTVAIATRHQQMFRRIALLAGPPLRDGEIFLMTSGKVGSALRVGIMGRASATAVLAVAAGTANIQIPGITGPLQLDPSTLALLPAVTIRPSGWADVPLTIPPDPNLVGKTTHWQVLQVAGSSRLLGAPQALTFQ